VREYQSKGATNRIDDPWQNQNRAAGRVVRGDRLSREVQGGRDEAAQMKTAKNKKKETRKSHRFKKSDEKAEFGNP